MRHLEEHYLIQTLPYWHEHTRQQLRHVRIQRRDGKKFQLDWHALQRIKDDTMGTDATAVEYFPARTELVDEANIRHLWEVPDAAPMRRA